MDVNQMQMELQTLQNQQRMYQLQQDIATAASQTGNFGGLSGASPRGRDLMGMQGSQQRSSSEGADRSSGERCVCSREERKEWWINECAK